MLFAEGIQYCHCAEPLQGSDYRSYGFPDISYHSQRAWYCKMESTSRSVGVLYCGDYAPGETVKFLYVAYNFHWESQEFALPNIPEEIQWYLGGRHLGYGILWIFARGRREKTEGEKGFYCKNREEF